MKNLLILLSGLTIVGCYSILSIRPENPERVDSLYLSDDYKDKNAKADVFVSADRKIELQIYETVKANNNSYSVSAFIANLGSTPIQIELDKSYIISFDSKEPVFPTWGSFEGCEKSCAEQLFELKAGEKKKNFWSWRSGSLEHFIFKFTTLNGKNDEIRINYLSEN